MSDIPRHKVRDVAIIGPHGAGKTTLDEGLLFLSGATNKLGMVDAGSSNLDYLKVEKDRHMSVNSHISYYEYKTYGVNILDTPGFANFNYETQSALRICEFAILVVSAIPESVDKIERFWNMAKNANVIKMIFMNDMDKQRANFEKSYEIIKKITGRTPIPLTIPIGEEDNFSGVIDLINMNALNYSDNGEYTTSEIPDDYKDSVDKYREMLEEATAELDDERLEQYLEGIEIENNQLLKDLRNGVMFGDICPLLVGSASKLIGLHPLMDAINYYPPSVMKSKPIDCVDLNGEELQRSPDPEGPATLYVFKTISDPFAGKISVAKVISGSVKPETTLLNSFNNSKVKLGSINKIIGKTEQEVKIADTGDIIAINKLKDVHTGTTLSDLTEPCIVQPIKVPQPVISFAIEPKTRADEDKLTTSLAKIMEEDPTLTFKRNEETGDFLLSGAGQTHIEVVIERLKNIYGINVDIKTPQIPYRESIKIKSEAEGKYVKQTGGKGQYGVAWIRLEPLSNGEDYEFHDEIVGGVIPRNYIPSVEKGIRDAMKNGVLAGYPVTDLKVTVFDGKHHKVDSSDLAFQIASSMGFKEAMENAKPFLLEPIMNMSIAIPEDNMGDVIGDLNSRRGKVVGVDSSGNGHSINAQVPMSEILSYAPELRSITQGKGSFNMEFSHYEEVPGQIASKIIEETKMEKE